MTDAGPGTDPALADVVRRLVREFSREQPEQVVVRCVGRCHERLAAAGVREGLVERAEELARAQLLHPASTRPRLRAAPQRPDG